MAGPSFPGAHHHPEIVHREQQHGFHHQHLHRRDTIVSTVLDIVATVSVVQVIDSNGFTVATRTIFPYAATPTALLPLPSVSPYGPNLATPTPTPALPPDLPPTTSIAAVVPTEPRPVVSSVAPPAIVPSSYPAIDTAPYIAPSSNPGIDTALYTWSSIPPTSEPTTASITSSLAPSLASSGVSQTSETTLVSTSLTSAASIKTSTITSTPSSSILSTFAPSNSTWPSYANSSTTPSTSLSTIFTSSSLLLEPTTSSLLLGPASTATGVGATGTSNGAATPSVTGDVGGLNTTSSDNSMPSTQVLVGSVVGSVAGLALILVALLFLWRFRKQKLVGLPLGSEPADEVTSRSVTGGGPSGQGGMTQRSLPWALPAALAGLAGYRRNNRVSHSTSVTASSAAGSERGFYRVSGRKIQSVLESGGDGYGDAPGPSRDQNTMSSSSFPQGSTGVYGGLGASSSPQSAVHPQLETGLPILRPSPARTPTMSQRTFTPSVTPPLPHLTSAAWADPVGRSLPSNDGSHVSRFTEEV